MHRTLSSLAAAVLLALACAHTAAPPGSSGVGQFVFAGVVGGSGEALTIHWQYGFRFAIDPDRVSQVRLSCGDLPGSKLIVKTFEVSVDASRTAQWRGIDLPLTPQSVPWLFDSGATNEICQALLSRDGQPDVVEEIPVAFTAEAKQEIVAKLRAAHGGANHAGAD
ncbi:MAG TPA: hypothetical protein VEN47_14350 [Myxococcota bacterium]|nr:hypothetical protein [Myxococcota bacterium]